jgi:hypothetical protein
LKERRDLPKSRKVNLGSNPISEGIGPFKALLPKREKIIQAGQCICEAQVNEVGWQEGLTEVKMLQI